MWVKRFEERAKNPEPNQLVTDYFIFEKMYGSMQILPEEDELLVDTIIPTSENLPKITSFISS
jgi:hypothetical protein